MHNKEFGNCLIYKKGRKPMTNKHGGDIYKYQPKYDFSANINPLGVNEAIVTAARESLQDIANYPDIRCGRLRSALALKLHVPEDYLYFGKLHKKEYIGDALREIETEDIKRANRLLYMCAILSFALLIGIKIGVNLFKLF